MSEIATMPLPAMIGQPDVVSKPASSYNLPIGYLRAFIAVLVLTLTRCWRTPFAPPVPASLVTQPRWWQAFPVVDSQRWSGSMQTSDSPRTGIPNRILCLPIQSSILSISSVQRSGR